MFRVTNILVEVFGKFQDASTCTIFTGHPWRCLSRRLAMKTKSADRSPLGPAPVEKNPLNLRHLAMKMPWTIWCLVGP